ncbi:hypothetical protein [Streptomyces sp. NPDC015125]|uniref:hypothetical protein n=1 Tax=Streptomyces sp. NPDC015125 TaxID=3364938 RepID=UPI0036F5C72E
MCAHSRHIVTAHDVGPADLEGRLVAHLVHVPDHLLKEVPRKIGAAIWETPETALVDKDQDSGA